MSIIADTTAVRPEDLADADARATDPAIAAEAATTFIPVNAGPAASWGRLMATETTDAVDALARGDIAQAVDKIIGIGVVYAAATTECGYDSRYIEQAVRAALLGGAR
jgi:hypothetical protein